MKLFDAIEFVRKNDCYVAAINYSKKEITIIDYDPAPERFADVIIRVVEEIGISAASEGVYDIDEYIECEEWKNNEFFPIRKSGMVALDLEFDYAVKKLHKAKIIEV